MTSWNTYPWELWFSRGRFVLKKGVDFDCMAHSMSQQIRKAAAAMDLKVSVFIHRDYKGITVEVKERVTA